MPGASRRGAFVIYTDRPETLAQTLFRIRWKLAIVLLGFVILSAAIYLAQLGTATTTSATRVAAPKSREAGQENTFEPPAIVVNFLRAPTLAAKLQYVRDPAVMSDHIVRFYNGNPDRPEHYQSIAPVGEVDAIPGVRLFHVQSEDGLRLVALVDTPDGEKVDWPAFARLNPTPWKAFLDGAVDAPQPFRAHISNVDYYSGEFADPATFKCYQISSPELEMVLFGYAVRGSDVERQLQTFSAPVQRRCILELLPPAAPTSRQVVITRLIAGDWVASD